MKQIYLLIIFFHLLNANLQSQIVFPDTKFFSVTDGLSQSHINCILQDSNGFLWFGSEDGLNRYDGYNFQTYSHQLHDSTTLSNNFVNAICEDDNKKIWIATNKGLNCFDLKTGKITSYFHNPLNSNTISDNVVLNVYIDYQKILWIKTNKSLDRFDTKSKTFKRYTHYNDLFKFIPVNISYPIINDNENRLWVGTKDGLNYFDTEMQLFNRFVYSENEPNSISNDEIRAICTDKNNKLWIGTGNGLNEFDPITKKFNKYYIHIEQSITKINTLYYENKERIWIGSSAGLFIFNNSNKEFYKVHTSQNQSIDLPIFSIYKDNSGIFWVSSLKGLIKIKTEKPNFETIRIDDFNKISSTNNITAIYYNSENNLFTGTVNQGIKKLNSRNEIIQNFSFNKKNQNENNSIHCIYENQPNQFWVGTNNGIFIFDEKSNKTLSINKDFINDNCDALLENRINCIVSDKKQNLWIGTLHGLFKINLKNKTLSQYLNTISNNNTLSDNNIRSIVVDSNNDLWIGTENGLNFFETEKEIFQNYFEEYNKKTFLSNATILCLHYNKKNELWIGTISGLNKLNIKTKEISYYSKKEGLSDDYICAIVEDKKQNIWLSTRHGINMINTKTNSIKSYDLFDGLQDLEFNVNASFVNKKGEIFFGGVAGINKFHPDSIKINSFKPPIVITSVEIVNAKGNVENFIPFDNKITIPYKTPILTINFASLDFSIPEKNNFAYMFYSSKENNWVNINNHHSQTFSNLKPGVYYFKLKGSNNDLIWNENELVLQITINAPWWLRTEAFYIYASILIILIYIFYRYRTFNLRTANKLLKDKERASREIERQKEMLTAKNKNITDSINYAKRIQQALMPSEKAFKKVLPHSFVLHQPKDIVSGDFFWISERGNKIFVAAADCTGHGVPGAFMSIIGFELFRKITHNRGVENPSEILNILNKEFEEIFRDVDDFIKDGMDIAFCVIDKQTNILEFAGAVNPIYLVRDNKITEIKGSRFSVGLDENHEEQIFENKQIILLPDDIIYLFSDGYADQFGGPEGKKFKYRRFRHLLLTIHQYPIEKQHQLLEERINQWKGTQDQVDDILVIGFKPIFKCT